MTETTREPQAFFAQRFGIDHRVMSRVLAEALSRGGDFADLFFEHRTSSSIAFEERQVRSTSRSVDAGVGIRVVKGEATGYAYTEDLEVDAMLRAARTAANICAGGGAPPVAVGRVEIASLYPLGEPSVWAPLPSKLDLIRRADATARAHDPRVARVMLSYADELRRVAVATSDGRLAYDAQPMVRMDVTVLTESGSNRQSARDGGGGRYDLSYFDQPGHTPEDYGREAARVAVLLQEAIAAPAGTFPVVLGAGDSGVLLHEAVGHGLEADFNRKKSSNYADRVGEEVASPLCTVVDEGVVPGSRGTINVDDEGNAPTRSVLIEGGRLRGYMQDRISTSHFAVSPTGNGRRESFRCAPMPRMTNTSLLPGEAEPEEILRSVKKGLYCKSYSGGQVNISNGDFVFCVTEGYLVEEGRIVAPVKGVNLIGNGPDTLSKVTMVGNDFRRSDGKWTCGKDGQSVPVGVGMPSVLVSGITVGGTERSA